MGYKIWLHHLEPDAKGQSVEWHHANSPKEKKFKSAPLAGKVMAMVFLDSEGCLLVDIMSQGTTVNSDAYLATIKKLKA
jgi:hypothetical protein